MAKEAEVLVKDDLVYTIMIAQPEFITNEMVETALEKVKVKNQIRFIMRFALNEQAKEAAFPCFM